MTEPQHPERIPLDLDLPVMERSAASLRAAPAFSDATSPSS
jgi:hypothetical protein